MKNKLREMYENGKSGIEPSISADGLLKAISKKWITLEDAVEIIGGEDSLPVVKAAKLKEISDACNSVIVAGIDLELNEGTVHFNLSIEDQSNIANLFRVVELGGTEFPYQSDGGVCRIYTSAEIAQIYIAAQTMITTQTTYHNELKMYVQSLETSEDIAAVQYGMTLPDPYLTEMNEKLSVAQAQMNAIITKLNTLRE
jgi:hypothetical protein